MSQEEFQKIQGKIKSILKVRENNFGITNMNTTSIRGILITFSSIEMANKAEGTLKQHQQSIQFISNIPTKSQPKITLVGVDESISSLELMEIIMSQNPEVDLALQNGGTMKV